MLAKAPEESEYLNLIADAARALQSDAGQLVGGHYEVSGHTIRLRNAVSADDNFATLTQVVAADWVEAEQLFGCLRQFNGDITLQRVWCIRQMAVFSSSLCVHCWRNLCCGCG